MKELPLLISGGQFAEFACTIKLGRVTRNSCIGENFGGRLFRHCSSACSIKVKVAPAEAGATLTLVSL